MLLEGRGALSAWTSTDAGLWSWVGSSAASMRLSFRAACRRNVNPTAAHGRLRATVLANDWRLALIENNCTIHIGGVKDAYQYRAR